MSSNDATTNVLKRRSACDTCRQKKLKCDGEQPACTRCVQEGIECVYSEQKRMGRPKKRMRGEEEDDVTVAKDSNDARGDDAVQADASLWDGNSLDPTSLALDTTLPSFDMDAFDSAFTPGGHIQPWLLPSEPSQDPSNVPGLTPSLSHSPPTPDPNSLLQNPNTNELPQNPLNDLQTNPSATIASNPVPSCSTYFDPTQPTCACLSTIYLSLNDLSTTPSPPSFPSALPPLRSAMHTARTATDCQTCPQRFLTGLQNVQMLGTLLMSMATHIQQTLSSIQDERTRASAAGESKSLFLADFGPQTTSPIPSDTKIPIMVAAAEWATLATSALRHDVLGPTSTCPNDGSGESGGLCFMGLINRLEARQHEWHRNAPAGAKEMSAAVPGHGHGIAKGLGERSAGGEEGEGHGHGEGEHLCLKLVAAARRVIEDLNWEG